MKSFAPVEKGESCVRKRQLMLQVCIPWSVLKFLKSVEIEEAYDYE